MPTPKQMVAAADKEVRALFSLADRCASKHVISMARDVLKRHPEIHEFVMAMGSACFHSFDDWSEFSNQIDSGDPRVEHLHNFINEWDSYPRVSGEPMRFTRDSKIVRDWRCESHKTLFGKSRDEEAAARGFVRNADGRYTIYETED